MARYAVSLLQFMKPRGTCGGVVAASLCGLITVTCCLFQKYVLVLSEPHWRYMHEAKMCMHATHALSPSHLHKTNKSSQPTQIGVVNPYRATYLSEI